jgi:hypothetical protein
MGIKNTFIDFFWFMAPFFIGVALGYWWET